MLDINPSKRLTTNQILAHPWMTSRNQPTTNLLRHDSQHLKVKWCLLCASQQYPLFSAGCCQCNLPSSEKSKSTRSNYRQHWPVRARQEKAAIEAKKWRFKFNSSLEILQSYLTSSITVILLHLILILGLFTYSILYYSSYREGFNLG